MKNRTLPVKTPILFLITLLCATIASLQIVHAATITVTSTADSGPNTLRQALADANDGDTIDFSVTGTITLTSGKLLVNKNVTISGPGANSLAVDGNASDPVFYISSGKTVTIDGLTIMNGNAGPVNGAGIDNDHAALTVSNCTISGNSATTGTGGGIFNDHGTLTVNNSTVSGNSASGGGGIYNNGETSGSATLTITNSTVSGNSATTDDGGGIYNDAFDNGSATLTVTNSTITNGNADFGGGIFNDGDSGSATLTVNSSTISGNSAIAAGGGIFNANGATLTIGDTLFKAGASGANISNDSGMVTSLGYNLSSDDASAFLNQIGDQNSTDPMLGPLQDNGGPTFTHALSPGSPAVNAGEPNFNPNNFNPPMLYDQRGTGFARVVNSRIDIGAFEVQAAAYAAQIQQPINADGTSVFNVRRGVVPVKFTLTLNGVATCQLPPATIAVTRTAGGTTGPIDESVYTGSADTGSNFQYIYNLSASALGAGTYQVDIIINGQVVGSATFALK
jgi:hypothetical protein